ncbi:MAG: cupin domain-containing protein [Pseudomonadota bacterium]
MPRPRIENLVNEGWEALPFEPFREGIEICTLVEGEPSVAVLRYEPGARVPRHRHTGLETILVLAGMQSDEAGNYAAGTFVANPVGSEHSVWSEDGCVVLIQWEKPVEFILESEGGEKG